MDPAILAILPASPPPPGVTANFVDGEKYGQHPTLVGVLVTCMVLSTLIMALRLIARWLSVKTLQWLDFFAILGYICAMAFMAALLVIDDTRRGRHIWDMSLRDYLSTTEIQNIACMLYCLATNFLKISILLLFLQVFTPGRRGIVYWTNAILIAINSLFYFSIIVALIFECTPRAKISLPTVAGHCIDIYNVYLVTAVFNVISDFFILVYPLWVIWKLQMPYTRKIACSVAFITGSFAFVSCLIRLYKTAEIPHDPDIAMILLHVGLWASGELTSVILCSCFPFLLKLFRRSKSSQQREERQHSFEHLNGPPCRYPHREKPMVLTDASELEPYGIKEMATRSPTKREGTYSPV